MVVAHYHVPPHLLQYLDEDRCLLKASGIEWESLVEPHSGLFIVNHMPRKRPDGKKAYKAQSLEVRDSILAAPSVSQLLDYILILNRWDVLVRPKEGIVLPILASALQNLDHYAIFDASRFDRISPSQGVDQVADPNILVFFPLHLLSSYILQVVASISPVQTHQDLGRPGCLLVRFQQQGVAQLLYGLRLGTQSGPITLSCGDGSQDKVFEQQAGLSPMAPLSCRQALFPELPPVAALSQANILALQGTSSSSGNEL